MKTLNIVGGGKAARTLARLWSAAGVVAVGEVLARSHASAADACRFIGHGTPVPAMAAMQPAELWLLGVPDREIAPTARQLAESGCVRAGDGVFHLSGFTPSSILAPLERHGALCASLHPVFSFADPAIAVLRFAGALCGVEGDPALCIELETLLAAVGAESFPVDPRCKPLYHAGSVFAANFLVVIEDVARRAYLDAGVPAAVADRLMAPLARNALDNVLARGAVAALTGPAARGDRDVVAAQHAAVAQWDEEAAKAYAALTALAYRIAGQTLER